MNRNIFILITTFFFISCTNIQFIDSQIIFFHGKELQIGDILIKEKKLSFSSIFGHAAIIVDQNKVGDLPKFGEKYYEADLKTWLEKDRKTIVLRYKYMTPEFQKQLLKNIKKYHNIPYGIPFDKKNKEKMYCSQFIWFLYYDTANSLNFYLDIDSDQGNIVFPYDFLNSKELVTIIF